MIPDIGFMIGSYAVVRLVSLIARGGERRESLVVKVLAGAALVITLVSFVDLWLAGTK